jgi:hypothetical protein
MICVNAPARAAAILAGMPMLNSIVGILGHVGLPAALLAKGSPVDPRKAATLGPGLGHHMAPP